MYSAVALGGLIVAATLGYLACAAIAIANGASAWWFVLGLPLAWYALPFVLRLLWFSLACLFRAERPDDVRLTLRERVRMFGREMHALARSAPRMALYRVLMRDP